VELASGAIIEGIKGEAEEDGVEWSITVVVATLSLPLVVLACESRLETSSSISYQTRDGERRGETVSINTAARIGQDGTRKGSATGDPIIFFVQRTRKAWRRLLGGHFPLPLVMF